jgi:glutamate formiminotransferase / formiminotetrahydrofolate cyclodeaminase
MKKLIECVPNFSEGRNMQIIKQITDQIESVKGVKLLDVDPGESTNRTVVTMVGTPDEVCEAAFQAVKKAAELIDMKSHKGAHPRFGATDVCPLVPVANITMEEVVEYARKLAERIGNELGIPVYCYEEAAIQEKRKNLAYCRSGEYEGLQEKIGKPEWKPDFGPAQFNSKAGATAVGARDFLVAINYNLNTTSTRRANAIAFDVRERGRPAREGDPVTGKVIKDEKGNDVMIPGSLKATKAIGWFIDEYGIAQVSMNITNIAVTPVHIAFDDVSEKAVQRGVRITGSEIVGLIPKRVLIDAGKHYLIKQQRSLGVSETELIKIAVKSMGLDDLKPFNAREKVIEYILEDEENIKKLVDFSCKEFCDETASESPAPGGGSVAAYMGAMGAALATMVANLSSHKRGWDDKWEYFSQWAENGEMLKNELIHLVDEDTRSFNLIMDAFSLPKKTDEDIIARKKAIQDATFYATLVPLNTMKTAYKIFDICKAMAENGMASSASDVGVGALAATAGIKGAMLNVKINATQLTDKEKAQQLVTEADELVRLAELAEKEVLQIVMSNIK